MISRGKWNGKTAINCDCSVFCLLGLSNGVTQTAEQPKTQPEVPAQYAAVAFGQFGSVSGKSFGLTLYVRELTSGGEIEELVATLKNKGLDGLVRALEDIKDNGRHIGKAERFLADRRMSVMKGSGDE